jgi:hypothetical protein
VITRIDALNGEAPPDGVAFVTIDHRVTLFEVAWTSLFGVVRFMVLCFGGKLKKM